MTDEKPRIFYSDYVTGISKDYFLGEILYGKYLNETKFAKSDKILDVGSGRCWLARSAKRSNIISIDYNKYILTKVKKSCDCTNMIIGDTYELPVLSNSIDAINCHDLLEHIENPEKMFLEFRRVLRKGGYLYLSVPSVKTLTKNFFSDYTHIRPFHPKGLAMLSYATGFTNVNVHYADFIGARFYPLNIMIEKYFGFNIYMKYMRILQKIPIKNGRFLILEAFK